MFHLDVDGPVARLRIDHAATLNAIGMAGWLELPRLLEAAEAAGAAVLLLTGEPGGSFSAGSDLNEFAIFQADPDARATFRQAMRGALDAVAAAPTPIIALVEGVCYGAAVALAMACTLRVAGHEARFGITPARLGISYPQEDVHRLVTLVGAGQAARLLLGAETIVAADALRIGLVDLTGGAAAAETLAERIAGFDRDSVATLCRALRLARRGVASDPEQDRAFDALLGSPNLARRLAERRR